MLLLLISIIAGLNVSSSHLDTGGTYKERKKEGKKTI